MKQILEGTGMANQTIRDVNRLIVIQLFQSKRHNVSLIPAGWRRPRGLRSAISRRDRGTLPGHPITTLAERAFGRTQTLKSERLRQPASWADTQSCALRQPAVLVAPTFRSASVVLT
jgi:hypothetical protein